MRKWITKLHGGSINVTLDTWHLLKVLFRGIKASKVFIFLLLQNLKRVNTYLVKLSSKKDINLPTLLRRVKDEVFNLNLKKGKLQGGKILIGGEVRLAMGLLILGWLESTAERQNVKIKLKIYWVSHVKRNLKTLIGLLLTKRVLEETENPIWNSAILAT